MITPLTWNRNYSYFIEFPFRPHGPGDLGSEGFPFGSLDMAQQPTNEYLLPASSSSLPSRGGNPFG
jgi:hypothetical protein